MVRSLQSLRALGALMIYAHHFAFRDCQLTVAFGDYAVILFFMLSGFVLCMAYDGKEPPSAGRFLAGRFRRIAPLYYFSILLQLWVVGFSFDWDTLLPTLLMIQSWSADPEVYFGVYGLTWFVSSLMFCYLLFPFILRLLKKHPYSWLYILIGGLLLYGYCLYRIPLRFRYWAIYIFPPMQIPPFTIGMILYLLIGRKRFSFSPYIADLLILSVCLLSYLFMKESPLVKWRFTLSSYYWMVTAAVIVLFTITGSTRSLSTSILSWRPLVMLGNASFSFFMLHGCWLQWSREMMARHNIIISDALEFCIGLLILIPVSLLIHRLLFPRRL